MRWLKAGVLALVPVCLFGLSARLGAPHIAAARGTEQQELPSLDPVTPLTQYGHNVWQRADGLPQNTVMALAQTPDGYLWIATQDGLVRFDGLRFTIFNTTNTPALRANDIQALTTDRTGRLWIGTAGGGVAVLSHGQFASYGAEHGLTNQVISAIHEDAAGVVWVGTSGGGLYRFDGNSFTVSSTAHGLAGNEITSITHDAAGHLWVGTLSGVSRLADRRFLTIGIDQGLPSNDVRAVHAAADGTIWIGTTKGLVRWTGAGISGGTPGRGLSTASIRTVFEDRAHTLWVGTVDGGVSRVTSGGTSGFSTGDGLSDADARAVFEDREGSLWIGTNSGGLNQFKNTPVITYGMREGLSHNTVLPIAADRDGTLWVGTYGGGLNRLRDQRWTSYSMRHGLASDWVLSLAPGREGGMWVGTRLGVDQFRDGRFEHYGINKGLTDEPVLSLLETRNGTLWVGTRSGLKRLGSSGTRTFSSADGLGSNIITAILEGSDGALWVGTEGGGLSLLQGDRFRTYSLRDGLPHEIIWTITEDETGALWLGSNGGGLVRFQNGRFSNYTSREGFPSDSVYRVLDDQAGHLWINGNRGISRVRKQDLEAFDAGRIERIPSATYGEHDGMRSSETNGGIQPAGWRTPDGRLWFPTLAGVAMVDVRTLSSRVSRPQVIVEEVVIDRTPMDLGRPLAAGPGVRSLEFRYTAPTFLTPSQLRFRYRLEGFDAEWSDAGPRRTAYYTNVPPGHYRFSVIAVDGEEQWSTTSAPLPIHLKPHLYQTGLFYGACAVGLLGLGFALHRARLSGLEKRQEELATLAEERQRALSALKESEASFSTLFENVFEGVYRSRPDGRMLLANRACAALLGYPTTAALEAVPAVDLYVDPEDRKRLLVSLRGAGEVRDLEVLMRRRDGQPITVLESARVVRTPDGEIRYIEGTLFDITERKRLEEQNRQLQKMEMVGRLAGGVAHDFNNLLTPILGYCDLLLETLPEQDVRRSDVEEIRKAAESGGSLTRQLLAFSRQQVIERKVLQLNTVVRHIDKILTRLIGEHIDLELRLAQDLLPVRADAGEIEQVILNLAVNARDAMPGGGTITVETANSVARASIRLSVTDTGPGIPPEVLPHLFEPFFTTKAHGTGLGLSTVHDIVTRSGGSISVTTGAGGGASFQIELPAVHPVIAEPAPAVEQALPPLATGDETILLVEDNAPLRALAQRILAGRGYCVLVASDTSDAWRIASQYDGVIHLLLSDIVMPGGRGPELAARLRDRRPHMKVIFMTGYIAGDIAHSDGLDERQVIRKPFAPAVLLQRVRRVLDACDDEQG